ncbi:hypothetical protein TrVE_jg7583 [Triparma verrucosa]|uniref:Uncharacterized protein n=1 Tax=Triparma verrucosa TaxID=1606542 RepID=A0A9W7FNH0_9STRA|nr:hypothetical protein TrVE_jg7583 [Triparma verrucosa]
MMTRVMKTFLSVLALLVSHASFGVDAFAPLPPPRSVAAPPTKTTSSKRAPQNGRQNGPSPLFLSPPPISALTPSLPAGSSSELTLYFLRSCIDAFIPTVSVVVVLAIASKLFSKKKSGRSNRGSEMVEDNQLDYYNRFFEPDASSQRKGGLAGLLGGLKSASMNAIDLGPAEQFIKVVKLNEQYKSYDFSMREAVSSRPKALIDYRKRGVADIVNNALVNYGDGESLTLPQDACEDLIKSERDLLEVGGKLVQDLKKARAELGQVLADDIKGMIGEYKVEEESAADDSKKKDSPSKKEGKESNMLPSNLKSMMNMGGKTESLTKRVGEIEASIAAAEVDFVKEVAETVAHSIAELKVVSTEDAVVAQNLAKFLMKAQLEGGAGGILKDLQERPLSKLFDEGKDSKLEGKKNLFVLDFPGDVSASQVFELREEVSAICSTAKEGDEAMVVLQSGGGTVTGYGLAAAQLMRLKKKVKLTIAVEQVAASGGYMMACTGDRIVASPFAVLGSIGVISDQPNVYERLKREGIEFSTVTAGKYKRTLTPTKKPTKEDFEKSKQDVEGILVLFKDFVAKNRPSLDIDKVATGETWFGDDAMDLGLCDALMTKDEVILEKIEEGYNAFSVMYSPQEMLSPGLLGLPAGRRAARSRGGLGGGGIRGGVARWLGGVVREVIAEELGAGVEGGGAGGDETRKYMMMDDSGDNFKF